MVRAFITVESPELLATEHLHEGIVPITVNVNVFVDPAKPHRMLPFGYSDLGGQV